MQYFFLMIFLGQNIHILMNKFVDFKKFVHANTFSKL
jgi:hypothetical protein